MDHFRGKLGSLSDRSVMLILLGIAIGGSIASGVLNVIFQNESFSQWSVNWLQNLSTEMFGAFLAFWLLQIILGKRREKERLIRQMRSRDNGLALQAVGELGANGWLGDGSLKNADLWNANLKSVNIWDVNLKGADLHGANFQDARMERGNLTGANLWKANLQGITMFDVTLEGADLFAANLEGAVLYNVEFDERTRLPDGSKWSPDADLTQFGARQEGEPPFDTLSAPAPLSPPPSH